MKTRAAIALEKGKPLTVTEVELDGPKAWRLSRLIALSWPCADRILREGFGWQASPAFGPPDRREGRRRVTLRHANSASP
jgi:Zn-dependent alcohol dehydrogenase